MRVRFLADADLNRAIVTGLMRREPSIDFQTAQAAGLRGKSDVEVLTLAAASGRVLVSHDTGTMPSHLDAFRLDGKRSPGVFLIPQKVSVAEAIEELLLIWLISEPEEWADRIEWLPL